jgi:4-hydroxy-2-oxoheptanedioate aldolase
MKQSRVKEIWKKGGVAIGTLVKSTDPVHSEVLSQSGLDFLWYDLEHADKSVETFASLARASRVGDVDILARPGRWEYMRMGRLLEAGALGILYPRCESADEAREVVRWSKFYPAGERGFDGGSPDNNYGQYQAEDYTNRANEDTWVTTQIESPKALVNVSEIASVAGVDCVFFGPGDYSALIGRPGDVKGDETLEAARIIAEKTLAEGKVFGTLAFDMDHAKHMKDLGAQLIVHSADIVFYKKAYEELVEAYRDWA